MGSGIFMPIRNSLNFGKTKVVITTPMHTMLLKKSLKTLGYLAKASEKLSPLLSLSVISSIMIFVFLFFACADKILKIFTKERPAENITHKFLVIISFSTEETPKEGKD